MYKLVALDLDGTLLNSKKEISTYNMKVIKKLEDSGIRIVLATGRTFTAAYHYYLELGLNTPIISCNGGFIYNPKNDEVIFGKPIIESSLVNIIELLDKLNIYYQYYSAKKVYTKRIAFLTEEWTKMNLKLSREAQINIEVISKPLNEIRKRKEEIYKVLLTDKDESVVELVMKELSKDKSLEFVVSVGNSLDIMAAGITKGAALERMANFYNIGMEDVISIGDNHNDISMIENAGCGIAMENSETHIKKFADIVAPTNNENGVGVILNEIFNLNFLV